MRRQGGNGEVAGEKSEGSRHRDGGCGGRRLAEVGASTGHGPGREREDAGASLYGLDKTGMVGNSPTQVRAWAGTFVHENRETWARGMAQHRSDGSKQEMGSRRQRWGSPAAAYVHAGSWQPLLLNLRLRRPLRVKSLRTQKSRRGFSLVHRVAGNLFLRNEGKMRKA